MDTGDTQFFARIPCKKENDIEEGEIIPETLSGYCGNIICPCVEDAPRTFIGDTSQLNKQNECHQPNQEGKNVVFKSDRRRQTIQEDNSVVRKRFKSDPETQSDRFCSKPSSSGKDNDHNIVKQEVLDSVERAAVYSSYVAKEDTNHATHSFEDTKPVVGSPCPNADSASLKQQSLVHFPGSNIYPRVIPFGLYYNTAHPGHSVKSEFPEPFVRDGDHVIDHVCDPASDRVTGHVSSTTGDIQQAQTETSVDFQDIPLIKSSPLCTSDRKTTNFFGGLQVHGCPRTPKEPFKCDICSRAFSQSSDLKRHELKHTGEKPYTCSLCSKAFTRYGTLKQHELTHTGEKPYTCNFCSKTFSQSSHLKAHQLTHTGEKPYTCNFCSKTFSQSGTLKAHERTHTGEKPYTCNMCSKTFSQSGSLKKHELTHTGEKPYTCNLCSKIFSQSCSLKRHERTHTGETPYTCNLCSKRFARCHTLKRHELTHKCNDDTDVRF